MKKHRKRIGFAVYAGLLAFLFYFIVAEPGLISDPDSLVPLEGMPETHQ